MTTPAMPELPEPDIHHHMMTVWRDDVECEVDLGPRFTADQMRAYALATLQAQPAEVSDDELRKAIDALRDPETVSAFYNGYYTLTPDELRRAILALRPQAVPMTDEQDAYKQTEGSKNCMQCAAAYMLGLPLAEVPDFEQAGPQAWESFYEFFEGRGFTAEMFPPSVEIEGDYLASGDTERGTSHMVVMRGGKLLHDPHPSNAGLKSVQVVWLIARRSVCITAPAGGEVDRG